MTIAELTAEQREELIRRSWATNDGLWFHRTASSHGLDAANQANADIVREFAKQEMSRLMKALGISAVVNLEQYRLLYDTAFDLFVGSLVAIDDSVDGDAHDLKISKCFAHLGVTKAGVADRYHCGPGERLVGWLEAMGLRAEITPGVGLCQMHHVGSCGYRILLNLAPTSLT
jgi:hypothetical protein